MRCLHRLADEHSEQVPGRRSLPTSPNTVPRPMVTRTNSEYPLAPELRSIRRNSVSPAASRQSLARASTEPNINIVGRDTLSSGDLSWLAPPQRHVNIPDEDVDMLSYMTPTSSGGSCGVSGNSASASWSRLPQQMPLPMVAH
jgi:hypothetical protein